MSPTPQYQPNLQTTEPPERGISGFLRSLFPKATSAYQDFVNRVGTSQPYGVGGVLQTLWNQGIGPAIKRVGDADPGLPGPMMMDLPEKAVGSLVKGANPTYYSTLENAIRNPEIKQQVLSRDQALALTRAPGVKAEEVKFLGMDDLLRQKAKWTKQELLDHIGQNQIDVHQITPTPVNGMPDYSKYTLPGGDNYREHALVWGNRPGSKLLEYPEWLDHHGLTNTPDTYYQWSRGMGQNSNAYSSPHWNDQNILAHYRTTDRVTPEGKKVFFLEEAQSDWKKHLREQNTSFADSWDYEASKILHDRGMSELAPVAKENMTPEAFNEVDSLARELSGTPAKTAPKEIPLTSNYHELVMKRAIRQAVDEGYDAIGWTTGNQQAQRYNRAILDNIGKIDVEVDPTKGKYGSPFNLKLYRPGEEMPFNTHEVGVSSLPNVVGRENARKILSSLQKESSPTFHGVYDTIENKFVGPSFGDINRTDTLRQQMEGNWEAYASRNLDARQDRYMTKVVPGSPVYRTSLPGSSLIQDAGGYSDVYDRQMRQVADKIGKKFGVQTQLGQIGGGEGKWIQPFDLHPDFVQERLDAIKRSPRFEFSVRQAALHAQEALETYPTRPIQDAIETYIPTHESKDHLMHLLGFQRGPSSQHTVHLLPLSEGLKGLAKDKGFPLYQAIPPLGAATAGSLYQQLTSRQPTENQ